MSENAIKDYKDLIVGSTVSVNVIVRDFSDRVSRNGSHYGVFLFSMLDNPNFQLGGKLWNVTDSKQYFALVGHGAEVIADVSEWNGNKELVVTSMSDLGVKSMPVHRLKEDSVKASFEKLLSTRMSEKAQGVAHTIFDQFSGVKDSFYTEFAAMKMHDNCTVGLLHHTCKCMALMDTYIIVEDMEEWRDLLMLGVTLHDIGKIYEMHDGVYLPNTFNGHSILALEIMVHMHPYIKSVFDEGFYQRLVSIIVGHHDEYDNPAKTIYALLVHKIDDMEAFATNVRTGSLNVEHDVSGDYTFINGKRIFM